mgnify:CR=1 FL=1
MEVRMGKKKKNTHTGDLLYIADAYSALEDFTFSTGLDIEGKHAVSLVVCVLRT